MTTVGITLVFWSIFANHLATSPLPHLSPVVLSLFGSTSGSAASSASTSSDDTATGMSSASGEDRDELLLGEVGERGGMAAEREEGEERRTEGRVGVEVKREGGEGRAEEREGEEEGMEAEEGRKGNSAGPAETKPLLNGAGGFTRPKHPLAKFVM